MGYDYAYQGGSYYSCVNNDIVLKRINEFKNIELNEFGLFIYQEEGDFHLLFFWKIFREKWKNPKLFKLEIFYRLFKSISFKNYSHINCYKINHLYL